ncbi:MAG: HAD family hydrolase [Sumerlaeia bacterium]
MRDSPNALIVFDLDGTLVDAFGDIRAAVNHALARREYPEHDHDAIHGMVGNGLRKLCERALPTSAPEHSDAAAFEAFVADTFAYYEAHPVDHARFFDGIDVVLQKLRSWGFQLAVLSNKAHGLTTLVAEGTGLTPLVDFVVGAGAELNSQEIPLKPDPGGIERLRQAAGTERAVMVGDSLPDAEAARRAGVPFVGVNWGTGSRQELSAFGYVAKDTAELFGLIVVAANDPATR